MFNNTTMYYRNYNRNICEKNHLRFKLKSPTTGLLYDFFFTKLRLKVLKYLQFLVISATVTEPHLGI